MDELEQAKINLAKMAQDIEMRDDYISRLRRDLENTEGKLENRVKLCGQLCHEISRRDPIEPESLPPLVPKGARMVAHETGAGWYLSYEVKEGNPVTLDYWPFGDRWVMPHDLEALGFEVV